MSWKLIDENLKSRKNSSLTAITNKENNGKKQSEDILIIQSSNDLGVIRNGGRRGAAFGAQGLTNNFLKLAKKNITKSIKTTQISSPEQEISEFDEFQKDQSKKVSQLIKEQETVIHIGGGHDHAYPLIDGLITTQNTKSKITIINLDAHLDTRSDNLKHSGTPFRQLKEKYPEQIDLIQVGIHDFANVEENYQNLDMTIFEMDTVKSKTNHFKENSSFIADIFASIESESLIILSLDIDAIDGHQMKAVSAVNHDGLPFSFINDFFQAYKDLNQKQKIIGLYEYNPLYDDLGCSAARALASTIYRFIK